MKKILFSILGFALIFNAQAQSNDKELPEGKWQIEVTPYVWIAGFRAETDFRQGLSTQVAADFSNIREQLEVTGSLHAEAGNGRFFVFGDLFYFKSDKGGFLDTEPADTRLFVNQWVMELGGGYNFVNNEDAFFIDGLLGLRNFNIDNRLTINGEEEFDRTISINDVFFGARMKIKSEDWTFLLRGDLGGFGWGSEMSWRIDAIGSYSFSDLFALNFGLQAISIDHRKDNYGFEMLTTGLTFGGSFRF